MMPTRQQAILRQRRANGRRKRAYAGLPVCRLAEPGPERAALREGKIARAKQLLADPNYPPPEVIQAIAEMLAHKATRFWVER